jgi:hypothetical protein
MTRVAFFYANVPGPYITSTARSLIFKSDKSEWDVPGQRHYIDIADRKVHNRKEHAKERCRNVLLLLPLHGTGSL